MSLDMPEEAAKDDASALDAILPPPVGPGQREPPPAEEANEGGNRHAGKWENLNVVEIQGGDLLFTVPILGCGRFPEVVSRHATRLQMLLECRPPIVPPRFVTLVTRSGLTCGGIEYALQ